MTDNTDVLWGRLIKTGNVAQIAAQLRHDQELCKNRRLPSLLALSMPPPTSDLAELVSLNLIPELSTSPRSIRNLYYSGVLDGIKAHLQQMDSSGTKKRFVNGHTKIKPRPEQFQTALTVLKYLLDEENLPEIHLEAPIKVFGDALDSHLNTLEILSSMAEGGHAKKFTFVQDDQSENKRRNVRTCYICQMKLFESHPQYLSLCKACGRFNVAESNLSLPENLNLDGKTAIVTGGRLNLGYHTALRLLRCGCKVIISTRYPQDAESRFVAEKDSSEWENKLRIVGADFRAAKDVFDMVGIVKDQLNAWAKQETGCGEAKLDILINNAAQTLTDPIENERKAIALEDRLLLRASAEGNTLVSNPDGYRARIRGQTETPSLLRSSILFKSITSTLNLEGILSSESHEISSNAHTSAPKSSWMQSLHEIPYEDVVSSHSVNTLVPLILIREFMSIMGSVKKKDRSTLSSSEPKTALAHIINVSSREGIFESSPTSSSKAGHHVHTNMSKAGLNMITETEAARCWRERRVAMNSVDPGYMSAAPEIIVTREQKLGKEAAAFNLPIGWEDGAGRVLWPIAASWGVEQHGEVVWGRFLKHFGKVEVSVGIGR